MDTSIQLSNRFREVILNGVWIANTNLQKQTTSLNWQQATTKINSLNTIALLTFHINYYIAGMLQVFDGGTLDIRDKYSFNASLINSEQDWQDLLNTTWDNAEKFADHIERMSDEKLNDVFVDEKYGTYRRNIEGMIEHSYYHLGQISLIMKLLITSENS